MVWLSAAVTPIFCVAIALGLFFAGAWPGGIVLLVFALIWASIFYCIRAQLRQCARLMEVAGGHMWLLWSPLGRAIGWVVCGGRSRWRWGSCSHLCISGYLLMRLHVRVRLREEGKPQAAAHT